MVTDPPAMSWVHAQLGPEARLGPPLAGGVTSRVHLVEVGERRAVLKQVTNRRWLTERPDVVGYEARVLDMLESGSIPVPRVLAVDEYGERAGHPSLLLSWIDGAPAGMTASPDDWLDQLVEIAAEIAGVEPPDWIRPFRRYLEPLEARPPIWSSNPEVWERAIDIVAGPPPPFSEGFIHRDYHPGNLLWNGAVVGVVDWSQASVGPIIMDAAHCRANLAIGFEAAVADRFRVKWEATSDAAHQAYWDLVTCVDFLPDWHPSARSNARLEAWLKHVLARLAG